MLVIIGSHRSSQKETFFLIEASKLLFSGALKTGLETSLFYWVFILVWKIVMSELKILIKFLKNSNHVEDWNLFCVACLTNDDWRLTMRWHKVDFNLLLLFFALRFNMNWWQIKMKRLLRIIINYFYVLRKLSFPSRTMHK